MHLQAIGQVASHNQRDLLFPQFLNGNLQRIGLTLDVHRVEYLSGDRHVYGTVRLGDEPARVIARLPATVETPIAVGERHDFAIPVARLRFFDTESGLRTEPVRVGV